MSYKLKLGVALAAAALALPTIASAQDPSTRTDLTIVGAVSADQLEYVADANAVAAPDMPIVYDDAAAAAASDEPSAANAEESATDSSADLGHAVESE
jgi:hypothetical protein